MATMFSFPFQAKMNDHHHNNLQKGESADGPDLYQPATRSLDLPRTWLTTMLLLINCSQKQPDR